MGAETALAGATSGPPGEETDVVLAVAEAIAAAGISRVFAFPGGGTNLPLLEALCGLGVSVAITRSEAGGAFMASTTADLTDRPSALLVGVGPGAASAANGVAHALLDRSPLLLVSDRFSPAEAETTGHQVVDHAALFTPITKAQFAVQPDDARDVASRALRICLTHPRGPVLLEVARDVAGFPVTHSGSATIEVPALAIDQAVIRDAATAISQARRPVLLVGYEARYGAAASSALVNLAARLAAPVLSTYKGKGVFPESHPLHAGIFTGATIEGSVLKTADLFLAVGVDPIELLPKPWPYSTPMVALRCGELPDTYFGAEWTVAAPISEAVAALDRLVREPRSEWQSAEVAKLRPGFLDTLRVGAGSLPAWRAVEVAQEEVGDAIVAVDAGAHMFPVTWFWRSSARGRFLISNGLASMGYAVPAAIAASLVHARETVLAFTGDGGFVHNGAELETAARLGAKVIVIVMNDASLSLIRVKQEELGAVRPSLDYLRSDFALFAHAFGVRGITASSEAELREALRAALAADGSSVLDVRIDGSEYGELNRLIRGQR
jgi:acetolactate synthase-1/2/3 large subunit